MTDDPSLDPKVRWRHRRRMAYIALFSTLIVMGIASFYIPVEKLKVLDEVIEMFYFTMGAIIGTYVGFSTFDDKWKK